MVESQRDQSGGRPLRVHRRVRGTMRLASLIPLCLAVVMIATGFAPGRVSADTAGGSGPTCTAGWTVVKDVDNSFTWQNLPSAVSWTGSVQLLENVNETCVIIGARIDVTGPALGGTLSLNGNVFVSFSVQYPQAYDRHANVARNAFGNLLSWNPAAGVYTGYTIETHFDINARGADEYFVQGQGIPAVVTNVRVSLTLPMALLGRTVRAQVNVGPDLCQCKVTDFSIPDGTGSHPFWAVYVHAHPDDWQLFESPDSVSDYKAGYNPLFVYATAGDAGIESWYWQARQDSAEASVRWLVGIAVEDAWWTTICYTKLSEVCHPLWQINYGRTTSIFMHLPDGNGDGGGFNATGFQSLARLRDGNITSMTAVDNSTTYTGWDDVYLTLKALISSYAPYDATTKINAPDFDRRAQSGDHSDHLAVADAVYAITIQAGTPWTRTWFIDYPIAYADARYPANLDPASYELKKSLFMAYSDRMKHLVGIDEYSIVPWFYENCFQRDYSRVG